MGELDIVDDTIARLENELHVESNRRMNIFVDDTVKGNTGTYRFRQCCDCCEWLEKELEYMHIFKNLVDPNGDKRIKKVYNRYIKKQRKILNDTR